MKNILYKPGNRPLRICILAGEASGDMHAAEMLGPLLRMHPDLEIFGLGGDQMKALGVELFYHIRDLSILGFLEVVRHLPFIRRVFMTLKAEIKARQPDLVIFVDYPGFNLRFAGVVKKMGFKTLYYISPQVWAWGKKRITQMSRRIDRLLVILPFEKEVYAQTDLDVRFVGHPLKDVVRCRLDKTTFFHEQNLQNGKPLLALLPGSRRQEVQKLLPEMAEAARLIQSKHPDIQILVGAAATLPDDAYTPWLDGNIRLCRNVTYDLMAHADLAVVASGTATLEVGILGTPMIIIYKIAPLSYLLGRWLIKIKHIGLVNIVAGKEVVPELIQHDANAGKIADEALKILESPLRQEEIRKGLSLTSAKLGQQGAAARAAQAVSELLTAQREQC